MSSAAGAGNAVLGWVSMRGSSTSMTGRSHPSSRSANSAVVIAAIGAASASMNSIRAAGTAGSIGTYAAPVLSTAKIATIASADRDNSNATRCPGPAPWPTNKCANRFDASSSSRYVHERPSKLSATAPGARATCAANNAGIDTPRHCRPGQHRPITPPIQPGTLSLIQHIDRRQPPPRISGHRHQHPLQPLDQRLDAGRVEHIGAKLHLPADPGGLTGLGPAFSQRKRQIHAGGVGIRRQRRDLQITQSPAVAGSAC